MIFDFPKIKFATLIALQAFEFRLSMAVHTNDLK